MKVATYYHNRDIRIEERPVPTVGNGELLLKVLAAGICGSDIMEWYRVGKGPLVLGHEVTGEIAKVGQGVRGFKRGERVVAFHHVPCFKCHFCRLGHVTDCETYRATNFDPGGFAEWIRLPALNVRHGVRRLPRNVSFEEGTFVEPLACVVRGQKKACVRKGQTVVVIGSGISGLLHIQLARVFGARRIVATDLIDLRLETARRLGADYVFSASEDLPTKLREVNEGRGADVVIVCAGARSAAEQALATAGKGGTVLFFALADPSQIVPLAMNDLFWRRDVTLMSSYAASPEDHRESLALIRTGRVKVRPLISHRLSLEEAAHGFALMTDGRSSLKVILKPHLS